MRNKRQPEVLEVLSDYIQEFMPYIAGLSENTIRLYKATFRLLFAYLIDKKNLMPENVTFQILNYETIVGFLDWLETEKKCSVATRNVRLASLSSFANYAQNRNLDAALVFLTTIKKIPDKKAAVGPRTFFTRDEVAILLRIPDASSSTGKRDTVLLSLMYATGARAQEVCDIKVRDVLFEADKTTLFITGKGKKTRRVIVPRPCAKTLKQYLIWQGIDDKPDRHIFSSQTHEHMTISCIEAIFKKYLREAKKQNPSMFLQKRYSPHSMRHTSAMHRLEAGVPMMSIKNFLGHAHITTTECYAELSQSTVDKHIAEWNNRWFQDTIEEDLPKEPKPLTQGTVIPAFLK